MEKQSKFKPNILGRKLNKNESLTKNIWKGSGKIKSWSNVGTGKYILGTTQLS